MSQKVVFVGRAALEKCVLNCDDHCTVVVVIRVRIFDLKKTQKTMVTSTARLGSEGRTKILSQEVYTGQAVTGGVGRAGWGPLGASVEPL